MAAFKAVAGTPMAQARSTPQVCTQRLLQADWLLRHYGFAAEELAFDGQANLSLAHDPKLAWALQHPELFPIEINRASADQLLRIPGLTPLGVKRILRLRTIRHAPRAAHCGG
jgi:predicted DNA-binding helix-hairpin-helix protein